MNSLSSAWVAVWSFHDSPVCHCHSIEVLPLILWGDHLWGSCHHLICEGTSTWKYAGERCSLQLHHLLSLPWCLLHSCMAARLSALWWSWSSHLGRCHSKWMQLLLTWKYCEKFSVHQYHTGQFLCCECCGFVIHFLNVIWIWSICLCWVGDISLFFYLKLVLYLYISLGLVPLLRVDLQQEQKWFLKPHYGIFLPNAGQSLYECVMLHLLHV